VLILIKKVVTEIMPNHGFQSLFFFFNESLNKGGVKIKLWCTYSLVNNLRTKAELQIATI